MPRYEASFGVLSGIQCRPSFYQPPKPKCLHRVKHTEILPNELRMESGEKRTYL